MIDFMRFLVLLLIALTTVVPLFGQDGVYADLLNKRGITNRLIREAFLTVPREPFAPEGTGEYLARDTEVPYPDGGFIIKPSLALSCLVYLSPRAGDRCLVAGNGVAYPAALLASICQDTSVIEESEDRLSRYAEVVSSYAVGEVALSGRTAVADILASGPFDIILLAGASERVSKELLNALEPGGRLLVPLTEPGGFQILVIATRGESGFSFRALRDCFFPKFEKPFPW